MSPTAIVLSLFLAGHLSTGQLKTGLTVARAVEKVDVQAVVQDIKRCNPDLARVIPEKFLVRNLKPMLLAIAYAESKFKYLKGRANKNDYGYFQINTKVWNRQTVKEHLCYTVKSEKYYFDPYFGAQVAARILAYNISRYILLKGYGHPAWKYALTYHNFHLNPGRSYKKDVKLVLWRFRNVD